MKNSIVISLLVLGMSFINLQAQDKKIEHRAKRQEAKKEMKAYMDTEIKPVITSQRAKLDTYLSRREQKEVEALRIARKELRASSGEFRKNIKETYKGPNSLSDEQKSKSRELAKEKRSLDTRAWAIVDAHEDEITQLIDEFEPNMETWRTEMRAMMQKNMPERKGNREDWIKSSPRQGGHGKGHMKRSEGMEKGKRGGRQGFRPGGDARGMNLRHIKSPLGFLLWDGSEDLSKSNASELSIFPNPSVSSNTLKFTLKASGPVTVNILNDRGILVKTLLQENREAGTYTEKFDLSELEKGLYLYQVKTVEGINTKKLIIEK